MCMIDQEKAYSSFAAPDIEQARAFYTDTLGIRVRSEDTMGLLILELGGRETIVYPKPDHQPANYTMLNFPVDDLEATVDELASRGVTFERYAGFDQDERGIARGAGGPDIAWFTDPAGNILSVHTAV